MQYGYFDDANREYVITRPDTPAPWANYLGSPEYGALISNNAGGYSFAQSGADGRLLRYEFNASDEPGRYIYIRDNADGDFWTTSWHPVNKPLDAYKSVCRHGMGYTIIEADYRDIHSEVLYYVPFGSTHEVWAAKITNTGDTAREVTVTGYAEFTNHSNYEQDLINMQYSKFITKTEFRGNRIRQTLHDNLRDLAPEYRTDLDERIFGLAGQPVSSYCGIKDAFLGRYRGYGNPEKVAAGDLGNGLNYCDDSCGALSTILKLAPGETATLTFVFGEKREKEAEEIMARYEDNTLPAREVEELKKCWADRFEALQINTPSPELNTMINTWNAYNCYMTFIWSRAASFTYCGLRNGYGYRDTVQDIQGIIHLAPEMAADKIRLMVSGQCASGGGLPVVKYTHQPGKEKAPVDNPDSDFSYRADDALWLFPTIYKYISETGNMAFLDESIPYADEGESTVYDHLKRALLFSENHMGPHHMPAGLLADWNDCLRLGRNGESTFVAFQYYYAMKIMRQFANVRGDNAYSDELAQKQDVLAETINRCCYDEDRYIRGFAEDGSIIGAKNAPEANEWLNPQSWAVISGLAEGKTADTILDQVFAQLNTPYGAVLMDPPYHDHVYMGAGMRIYHPGVKENAAVFSQSQGWIILAEALAGHGERAFTYFMENAPVAQNDRAEIRRMEPYCYGQFTEGKASPYFGRSHVHWLTGTASTMMVGCVEGILGLRPDPEGIFIAPSIPASWDGFTMTKLFRGKKLNITVKNPDHHESGVASLILNGKSMDGGYIPAAALADENDIVITL